VPHLTLTRYANARAHSSERFPALLHLYFDRTFIVDCVSSSTPSVLRILQLLRDCKRVTSKVNGLNANGTIIVRELKDCVDTMEPLDVTRARNEDRANPSDQNTGTTVFNSSSRLLRLPGELRNRIYEYALSTNEILTYSAPKRSTKGTLNIFKGRVQA
jgi:hypothetical protein